MLVLLVSVLAVKELFAADPAKTKAAAASLPSLTLNREAKEWVHVLSEGWATPLTGFMKEQDYLSSLHYQHINRDGELVPMPVPIILPLTAAEKDAITGTELALKDETGEVVAVLKDIEFFAHRKEERATRTFGINAERATRTFGIN